jgi:hypothetical protein
VFVKIIEGELNARGITINQIGSHTSRKTGASYVSSISAIHSYTAFCLRFGWALGGSQGRYVQIQADKHGDCVVGRILAGLAPDSAEFATILPYFIDVSQRVVDAVSICFPLLPPNMLPVAQMCLASLIYHREFLREKLPSNHPGKLVICVLQKLSNFTDCAFFANFLSLSQCCFC